MLSNGRAVEWREGQSNDGVWFTLVPHEKDHACAVELAGTEFTDRSILPYPVLLPLMREGIVGVEALSVSAADAGPVLQQRATATPGLDYAAAGHASALRSHCPLPDPEIEAMSFGVICTGSGCSSWG